MYVALHLTITLALNLYDKVHISKFMWDRLSTSYPCHDQVVFGSFSFLQISYSTLTCTTRTIGRIHSCTNYIYFHVNMKIGPFSYK